MRRPAISLLLSLSTLLLSSGTLLLASCSQQPPGPTGTVSKQPAVGTADPLQYVDPLIGTDGKGKTFPGATVPHGMVQLSPDNGRTGWDWIAGYFYPDTLIAGFSHTHLSGTGAGDLYDISFMPVRRPYRREALPGGPESGTIVSGFSHQQESAKAGLYQVYLADYDIDVALTAGPRSGLQRYRFAASTAAWTPTQTVPMQAATSGAARTPTQIEPMQAATSGTVRLDLGYSRNWDKTVDTHLKVIDAYHIAGYRKSTGWAKDQRVYFYSKLSRPISRWQLENAGKPLAQSQPQAPQAPQALALKQQGSALALEFDVALDSTQELLVHTAISSVSIDNAKANLAAEPAVLDFAALQQDAQQRWRNELSRIAVTAPEPVKTQFYTAMYHAALAPRLYSDVDGRYKGPDGSIRQSPALGGKQTLGGKQVPRYEFFSLWDTFRALHPWLTLVKPSQNNEMLQSLLAHYRAVGRLPVWSFEGNETDMMLGYHSVPVLVDAYLKGQLNADPQELLQAALQSARQQEFGLASYQQLGYVPYNDKPTGDRQWNVALTLEYAFDDAAIARLASHLGQQDIASEFNRRAQNYRQHYDSQTGFMRAKNRAGQFRLPFDPNAYHPEDYCEANAWQYSFFVPHDIPGMIALMGGAAPVAAKLDAMFTTEQKPGELPEWISGFIGQYVHGNEPSHHVPYLYQYLGQGHKTELLVRRIMTELYQVKPDGLAGNEDAGQLSAWYLFSALGFYPVDPVSGEYVFGSPLVERAVIALENGRQLVINTENQAADHPYVQQILWNGQPLSAISISHQQLAGGGELTFIMSATP